MKRNIIIIVACIIILGIALIVFLMKGSNIQKVEFGGTTYEYNDYNKTNSSLGGELAIP